jgi:hypothetical protein
MAEFMKNPAENLAKAIMGDWLYRGRKLSHSIALRAADRLGWRLVKLARLLFDHGQSV